MKIYFECRSPGFTRTMFGRLMKVRNAHHPGISIRNLSLSSASNTVTTSPARCNSDVHRYKSFDELISQRRSEANRSVMVRVPDETHLDRLVSFCNGFGTINNCFFYRNKLEANYFLLEFASRFAVPSMLNAINQSQCSEIALKALNPFLVLSQSKNGQKHDANQKKIYVHRSANSSSDSWDMAQQRSSLEEHVQDLFEKTRLDELSTRLRFLAALQIESLIGSIFPSVKALPFGSSVNGFGRIGSDLDLVLLFDQADAKIELPLKSTWKVQHGAHHMIVLQTISRLMENWTPGVVNTIPVLNARVPIIKYKQNFLDLDVDLSAYNLSSLHMSELIYLFGEIDARVRPLNFFVRHWAREWKITRVIRPGPWISNFMLSCLVLFFLQQLKQPILPPINELNPKTRPPNRRPIKSEIDCVFLRDISQLNVKTTNTDSLVLLIEQFFDFIANFDFTKNSISLNSGQTVPHSDFSQNLSRSMHIVNPLESGHNVSVNVSFEEITNLQTKAKHACERFRKLQHDYSQSGGKQFVAFFKERHENDIHRNIITRMNAEIEKTLFPRQNSSDRNRKGGKKNPITVRWLTKAT